MITHSPVSDMLRHNHNLELYYRQKMSNEIFVLYDMYIYNIRTLSVNIKFICTSFRNRQNSEPLASFSDPFRSEYK